MDEQGPLAQLLERFATYMRDGRTQGQQVFNDRTRMYPYRLGTGPAAPEEYLARQRGSNMYDAQAISDAVPRRGE